MEKNSNRIWLFRILVGTAEIIALVSFIMPWWIGHFDPTHAIYIYGWGLRSNVQSLAPYVTGDVTPLWKVVLAWAFLGISVGLAMYSTLIKKWWGVFLLGFIGLGLIAYVTIAINIVVKNRLEMFNIPLEGSVVVYNIVKIHADLQFGHYLAYISGGIMMILALLRNLIVGKQHLNIAE